MMLGLISPPQAPKTENIFRLFAFLIAAAAAKPATRETDRAGSLHPYT